MRGDVDLQRLRLGPGCAEPAAQLEDLRVRPGDDTAHG